MNLTRACLLILAVLLQLPAGPAFAQGYDDYATPSRVWQLGVRVRNTDLGAVITDLAAGSPATRAGLEVGDTILAVGKHRVGYVDRVLRDVADVCGRQADGEGNVSLLVMGRRRGNLANVSVRLGRVGDVLSGTLRCPPGGAPPPGSWVAVRLIELPRWKAAPVEITRVSFPYPGTRVIEYSLPYDQRDILPGRQYALEGWIANPGASFNLYQTPKVYELPRRFAGAKMDLRLDRLAAPGVGGGDEVAGWYRAALGREPGREGLAGYRLLLDRGVSRQEVRAQILAGTEFYDRCRNSPQGFIIGLYQTVLGRTPNRDEVRDWMKRLLVNRGNRLLVVREFLRASLEERKGP